MFLPKLEYSSRNYPNSASFREFIDKNLPLHPVIQSLRLDLSLRSPLIKPEDIKRWVEILVSRSVRELEMSYSSERENIFPASFYTCTSLVILKLEYVTLMDVPSRGRLPSLKTLKLDFLTYVNEESLQRLLSICPVLEELSVKLGNGDNMGEFTVIVPSLRSLSLLLPNYWYLDGYVIDTPSLEYFKLRDWNDTEHYAEIRNMPNLREAYVDVVSLNLKSLIRSITSVKRLTICSEDDVSGIGFVFNQLEHLKLCVCKKDSSNLLGQLLKGSPNLRVLDICVIKDSINDAFDDYMGCWNQPSPVPECLLSSLQILTWSRYFGRPQDRDIAVYILRNACRLKTATIWADTVTYDVPNLKMIKELTLSSRASSTCELVFVEDESESESESE